MDISRTNKNAHLNLNKLFLTSLAPLLQALCALFTSGPVERKICKKKNHRLIITLRLIQNTRNCLKK